MHRDCSNQRVKAWESTVRRAQFLNQHQSGGRRRGFLFSPMSVAPEDDESSSEPTTATSSSSSSSSSDLHYSERRLPNGDFYSGQCSSSGISHGRGKYLWTDGCVYEGEWRRGAMTGQGKFSWPCGASYEGEFKSGFMDGYGSYIGSFGDSYRGAWSMNHRHALGFMSFSNGDFYDGDWRSGFPDGHGRYAWANGKEYSGQWQTGVITGKGSFSWIDGNRFDGGWEDGRPVGSGRFRWADGSLYIGVWNKASEEEQEGLYYPSPSVAALPRRNPKEYLLTGLNDCKICTPETISVLPSQKLLSLGKPKQRKPNARARAFVAGINGNVEIWDCGDEGRRSSSSSSSARTPFPLRLSPRPARKQGITISKGHKNYELMLNLQLGIRHAVGRQPGQLTNLDLKASAFDPKEKVWTKFPPEGTKCTPPHQSCDFKWKDYCPLVFRTLRKLFKVDAADYMMSICGNDALRELSSPGKSGSFFYLTNDDRYMIKTMKKSEVKVLIRMLPAYYNHVRSFQNTLVTRFFGLHCVKLAGAAQKKVRFVIMGNLFRSPYSIHRRFDLKGSSHGRITDKPESEIDGTTTLKDLDLNFLFRLQNSPEHEFHRQIDRDCEFLEHERIMDYSLLVGVHFRDAATEVGYQSPLRLDPSSLPLESRLGINQKARVELTVRRTDCEMQLIGAPTGECYDVILFFGIIDILQDYDISKKLEHAYKSLHYDSTSISAVDPKQYAKRFRDFICRAFIEDT